MKLVKVIEFLRTHLRTVVRVCAVALALLILLDAIPGVVDKEEAHTAAEHVPGFWSVFGFVGCAVLIVVSKAFGKAGIMQREDYYDR